jgi:hypothetical protein
MPTAFQQCRHEGACRGGWCRWLVPRQRETSAPPYLSLGACLCWARRTRTPSYLLFTPHLSQSRSLCILAQIFRPLTPMPLPTPTSSTMPRIHRPSEHLSSSSEPPLERTESVQPTAEHMETLPIAKRHDGISSMPGREQKRRPDDVVLTERHHHMSRHMPYIADLFHNTRMEICNPKQLHPHAQ